MFQNKKTNLECELRSCGGGSESNMAKTMKLIIYINN